MKQHSNTTNIISGGQVVNVEQFAQELSQQNATTIIEQKPSHSSEKNDTTNKGQHHSAEQEEHYVDGADDVSAEPEPSGNKNSEEASSPEVHDDCKKDGNPGKILSFNRPFTWALFDRHEVPILAGVVSSLSPPESSPPTPYSFLGMDGIYSNTAYLNCV